MNGYAQTNQRENRHQARGFHHGNRGVHMRSQYRPNKARQYRPSWAHNRQYNRRWVYFPRYNFYWDNWREMYVYQNNNEWYVNTLPPPKTVNIYIENEKHYELDANEDDIDSIYKNNESHIQSDFKK